MIITSNASYNMDLFPYYMVKKPGMGARLYDLMWLISFPALLQGIVNHNNLFAYSLTYLLFSRGLEYAVNSFLV